MTDRPQAAPAAEEARLTTNARNRVVYERWRDRPAQEILRWHRQVQADVLAALREVPQARFSARERGAPRPFDLDGHATYHRVRNIERARAAQGTAWAPADFPARKCAR